MSWIMLDYGCACGYRCESLELRSDPSRSVPCPLCGGSASLVPSAPKIGGKTDVHAVTRGKSDERPSPGVLNTRPIAEGKYRVSEWKDRQRKYRLNQAIKEARDKFGT